MASWLLLLAGLAILIASGGILVKGAVGTAFKLHISTLVIGMTVVSFGTSAPELFVSLGSAIKGNADIAIGNVVGSNIANIALVLGISALFAPIKVSINTLRYDIPMMLLATLFFYLFAYDGVIERWEGIIMFVILLAFIIFLVKNSRKNAVLVKSDQQNKPLWFSIVLLLVGLGGLYYGSNWLIEGVVNIAKQYKVDQRIVAITIVAFGTSIPELSASIAAVIKKEHDISIGNIVGSNIFNIMAVLGITAIVCNIPVSKIIMVNDFWWMAGVAVIMIPLIVLGKMRIGRLSGCFLVASYFLYVFLLLK